jgi:hypothetical protein
MLIRQQGYDWPRMRGIASMIRLLVIGIGQAYLKLAAAQKLDELIELAVDILQLLDHLRALGAAIGDLGHCGLWGAAAEPLSHKNQKLQSDDEGDGVSFHGANPFKKKLRYRTRGASHVHAGLPWFIDSNC